MTAPLVSTVIPVFNGAKFVCRCIESVLAQTYRPIEVIVIDDGSTDESATLLRAYGERIRVIAQSNSGVSVARNVGIQTARGEFIAFLDQDDWWQPTKTSRQIDLFLADSTVGLVHTDVAHFDEPTGRYVGRLNHGRSEVLIGHCYDRLLMGNAIFNSSVVVRRSILKQVGGFSTEINRNTIQDYDLWLRIARVAPLAFVPEALTTYCLHPDQGMWNVRDSLMEEAKLLDRLVPPIQLKSDAKLRNRFFWLFNQLTIANLDVNDKNAARASSTRALQMKWSLRNALIWLLTFFPLSCISAIRSTYTHVKPKYVPHESNHVPSWAKATILELGTLPECCRRR